MLLWKVIRGFAEEAPVRCPECNGTIPKPKIDPAAQPDTGKDEAKQKSAKGADKSDLLAKLKAQDEQIRQLQAKVSKHFLHRSA